MSCINVPIFSPRYSYRSATIGSTRMARRAGRDPANAATPASDIAEPTIATGSTRPKPNNMLFSKCVPAYATGNPTATPTTTSSRFPQDQPQHTARLCTECHANSNVSRTARHGVGHDSVKPDARQHHGQQTKHSRQPGDEPVGV